MQANRAYIGLVIITLNECSIIILSAFDYFS